MFLFVHTALDRVHVSNSKRIELNSKTKLVLFSDLHRGVGDWADDFKHNSLVFSSALDFYYKSGYDYVEIGDGDELYENRKLVNIVRRHENIFRKIDEFHREGRCIYIWGNHNLQWRKPKWRKKSLHEAQAHIPGLFDGIEVRQSVKLGDQILIVHGHQGDLFNDRFAFIARFWVRLFWRWIQNRFGVNDPTSAAQNVLKRKWVEKKIFSWAKKNNMVVIAGHTHRPFFESLSKKQRLQGSPKSPYYFNCGSGIHPRCITCLEVEDMTIRLVKWFIFPETGDERRLRVKREVIESCQKDLNELIKELNG